MQGPGTHRRAGAAGIGLVAAIALLSGCTTYKPLDQGSPVPWAAAVAPRSGAPERVEAAAAVQAEAESPVVKAAGKSVGNGEITATVLFEAKAADLSGRVHRVERGETLSGVAEHYGVGLFRLAIANRLTSPYTLRPGQMLRIPGVSEDGGGTVAAAPAPATPKTALTPAPSGRYVVRPGDTLSAIARQSGVPMRTLAQANAIDPPYDVLVGQELRIPEARTAALEGAAPREPGAPPSRSEEGFAWPLKGKILAGFGKSERGERNGGITIAARKGTPVRAADNGVVVYAGDGIRGYGRMVLLRHADDYVTTYAHNAALLVNVGDTVRRGQVIARVGDSGDVTTPQLYFELRQGREPVDPEVALVDGSTAVASTE